MTEPFTVPHFRAWAKELELDNGKKWVVEPYFESVLEDVFSGFPLFWLLVPEGNAKTTNMSGLALYHCEFRPNAFVPWAASARDQAEIGYTQAKVFAESMPKKQRPRCYDGYRRIVFPNGSRIQIFAAGAEHADGVIPTMPLIDEGHRHRNLGLYRTWAGKLIKRGGQLGMFSTAGEPGGEFEQTREKIKEAATDVHQDGAFGRFATERIVLHEWAVQGDAILDMEAVKAANPFSGISKKTLAEKQADPTMTEAHWRRFTCNLPAMDEGKEPYIDLGDWDALGDSDLEFVEQATVCLGGDGSRTWDTTVIAEAEQRDDGTVLVDARVFSVRQNIPCHVLHKGGKIDFQDVEEFIIDRFGVFEVSEVAYDPRYLERSMDIVQERLPESCVFPVEPSSKNMREALQCLFNLAAEGKLRHRADPVIRSHIANAGVDRGYSSEIRRITKIDPRLPIDAVPAMALAVWRASQVPVLGGEFMFA